jgi:cell wall-associated NlpC family hydrolase
MPCTPAPPARWCVALALAAGAVAASAAPEPAPDPVMRLLQERGLVEPAAPVAPIAHAPAEPSEPAEHRLVRQVRDAASEMVVTAMHFLGVPYRRGGSSEDTGFDCSGFTRHIFETSIGLVLPRRVDDQAVAPGLAAIQRAELLPGDLVFFNTLKRTFSHVGIYIGDGKFIHSPRPGGKVRVEDMRHAYWDKRFTGARRAASASSALPAPGATAPAAGAADPAGVPHH